MNADMAQFERDGLNKIGGRGMAGTPSRSATRSLLACVLLFAAFVLLAAPQAFAGQAAPGELFFYPCDSCHPVAEGSGPIVGDPIDFEGHEIVLEGHDNLGEGSTACLVCHDDPSKDPGMLKLADGTFIAITGDTSRVCFQCHSAKYNEWKAGTHGRNQPKCTSSGCHDPHTPGYMYAGPLLPFVGSGFQFKVLPETEPFTAFPSPAPAPPVQTPMWFAALAALGLVVVGGQTFVLLKGRQKR